MPHQSKSVGHRRYYSVLTIPFSHGGPPACMNRRPSLGRPLLGGTGPVTVKENTIGTGFDLTQSDPDANGDNKTTLTYNIKVGEGVDLTLKDNTDIGFTVNGDTGTGSIIFDDDPEYKLSAYILEGRGFISGPAIRVEITNYGIATPWTGGLLIDYDGNDQFGHGGTLIDDNGEIGGVFRTERGGGWLDSHGTFIFDLPRFEGSGEATYYVAADFNRDGDVADSGEIVSLTHFWPEPSP